jgi:hypothetical protein
MDASDPSETKHTFTGLESNTVYFFRVFGENTACTLLEQPKLPPCCELHECWKNAPLSEDTISYDSLPVATLLPAMPAAFLSAATETAIRIEWPTLPGTPGNLAAVVVEYQDADRPSKEASDEWFRTEISGATTSAWLEDLRPNNRYNVKLKGLDTKARVSPYGPTSIVMTRPTLVTDLRVLAVEATSVSLNWGIPRGRAANIMAYNLSIQQHVESTNLETTLQTVTSYVTIPGDGSTLAYRPSGLLRNSLYTFSIAATNAAGDGKSSNFTSYVRTLLQDALASCTLYPVTDITSPATAASIGDTSTIQGSLFLFRASSGIRVQGLLLGLLPADYTLVFRQYGLSANASQDGILPNLDARLSLAEIYANKAQDAILKSTLSSGLCIVDTLGH